MDVGAMGDRKVRRKQDEPEQVKEQGLKLWQTVRDALDKQCVTDFKLCRVRLTLFLTVLTLSSTMFPAVVAHFQLTFF
jgi:hypothetical protein